MNDRATPAGDASFMVGGGETGALMRSIDWRTTPLGPVHAWPQSLRTSVSICLSSRFPIALYWGPEHAMLYNDSLLPMVGANKHPHSMGKPAFEVLPEIRFIIEPLFQRVITAGEATWSEDLMLPLVREGGQEESYFTFTYSPIRDESGGIGGIFCAVLETTEKVIEERRLRLLNALADATQAGTPDEACAVAAAQIARAPGDVPFALFYLVDGASGTARLAGSANLPPGAALSPASIALGDRSVWPFEDAAVEGASALVPHLPLEGHPEARAVVILRIERAGGGPPLGFIVAGLSPLLRSGASYARFHTLLAASISQSVSGAAAYEQERRRAESLAALDRAKTAFFSNVSHEFRTPLTLLLGPASDALSQRDLTTRERERWLLVHANARRLQKLVNTLLDFSRIEAGRMQARFRPTDLASLTVDVASAFRSAIERARLVFDVDCPPLPQAIYVDHDMWEKVVLNLLSNAFKFTFEGTIAVALRWRADEAELVVKDTGIGVAGDDLAHLFERFHRVEGAKGRTHEGSGIGLALVQELVRLHGGSIRATSVPGQGTTFTVVIPSGTAHLPADQVEHGAAAATFARHADPYVNEALQWLPDSSRPSQLPYGTENGSPSIVPANVGGRILVADDNADMRRYITRILEAHWTVDAVVNGDEARDRLAQETYDLVLTDAMMPGTDGFGLLQEVRADAKTAGLPVIMLSARSGEDSRVEGLRAGADDYMVKPFAARELLARVSTHLALGKARSETRAARDRLRDFFFQAPVAVSIVRGDDFVFELANPAYERMIGRSGITGKTLREVFPELSVDAPVFQMLRSVVATGEPFTDAEYKIGLESPSGALVDRYFLFTSVPVRGARGATDTVLTAAVDVTEQVRLRRSVERAHRELERALARAETGEAHFRALIDNLPDLAWNARPDGYVDFYNRHWYEYTGTTLAETEGEGWQKLHDPEILPEVVAGWQRSLATGVPFEMEFPLRGADGVFRWFLTRVRPLRDAAGTIVRWLGTNTNVEHQREAIRKAEEANLAKDEFLATASHELRTPLNAILGWSRILRAGKLDGSGYLRAVETIERNAQAQVRLIEDILDGSRIISGKLHLEIRSVDMSTVVSAAIDAVRPAADAKGIAVTVSIGPEAAHVMGDPERLQQVIWNLTNNAIKFTPKGGKVHVRLERAGTNIQLSVSDSGQGISGEFLPHIFERFTQADGSTTRRHGGLGLGLALVRHLVEAHGGSVAADSAGVGQGARFTVTLPVQAVYDPPPPAPSRRTPTSGSEEPPARLNGITVLVVDDEADARALIATVLRAQGAEVTTAAGATEGVSAFAAIAPMILVSDVGMPETDGYELIRRVRTSTGTNGAHVPAIALTAYAREEDRRRAIEAGFQTHVAKPVEPAELVRVVASLVQFVGRQGSPEARETAMKRADTFLKFEKILESRGVREALRFLNSRTPHRYTGIYRFDPPVLRNLHLVDSEAPMVEKGADAPMTDTYCSIVGETERPFTLEDARTDDRLRTHPARETVISYCGVLLRDEAGKAFGALCHFDEVPCEVPLAELPLMEAAGSSIMKALRREGTD